MMMGGAAAAAAAAPPLAQGGAVNKIERAHQMYREGQHEEALDLYTEALSMAKTKPQKIALHSNRAACYLKLHDFKKAAEECTLVLELDHKHTGALMLRAQTLVTLKEYNSALFDVNRLMELNPSSDVYQSLQARLKTQLSLAPIPECEEESLGSELEDDDIDDEEVEERKENLAIALAGNEDASRTIPNPGASASQTHSFEDVSNSHFKESEATLTLVDTKSVVAVTDQKLEVIGASNPEASASETHSFKDLANVHSKGWEAISNPNVQCKPTIPAQKKEATGTMPNPEAPTSQKPGSTDLPNVHSKGREPIQKPMGYSRPMSSLSAKVMSTVPVTEGPASHKQQSVKDLPDIHSKGWQAIPQPKGHSKLDYSRWNRVEDDSSEEEDEDEEEALPRYRFRVKTVGVRPVK